MRLIDGDEAIKKICKIVTEMERTSKTIITANDAKYLFIKTIESLSSVETEWIPCSEKLPENEGCYLITLDDNSLDVASYEIGTKLSQWHCGPFEDGKVIAWMSLPEPYREDGEA